MPARLERGGSQEDEQIKDLGGNEDNEREQKMGEGEGEGEVLPLPDVISCPEAS